VKKSLIHFRPSPRIASFLLVSIIAIGLLAAVLLLMPGQGEPDEARTEEVREDSRTLVECLERNTLTADIDGDGLPDLVYHDWIDDIIGPMLGACTAAGGFSEIPGKGQSEIFQVADLTGDGRDEIIFGGTSVSLGFSSVAVWVDDGLHEVTRRGGGELVLMEGQEFGGAGTLQVDLAWGCEEVEGSDLREIVQVRVRSSSDSGPARWTRVGYRLENSTVRIVSRSRGRLQEPTVRVGAAGAMVQRCDLRD
jgi:hypothetical protein